MSVQTKQRLVVTGLVIISIAILFNEWTFDRLASYLGAAFLRTEDVARIWVFDLVCLIVGITLVLSGYRANKHVRQLSDAFIGILLTVAVLILTELGFYILNNASGSANTGVVWHQDSGSFHQEDQLLGYKPQPNFQISAIHKLDGRVVYDVVYSSDEYGRRVTPVEDSTQRTEFILFFGGSYTFGWGVNDNQTLPYYVARFAPEYEPYNYGVAGYGPQHMLVQLKSNKMDVEVGETQGILIYTFIENHVNRTIGSMKVTLNRGAHMPFYTMDAEDRIRQNGTLISGRPLLYRLYALLGTSQIVRYFDLDFPRINDDHYRMTARLIAESQKTFITKFDSNDFYVLLYPGSSERLIPYLERSQIKYLDYRNLLDQTEKSVQFPGDGHPTSNAYEIIAKKLVQDLGISGASE